jgi:hypothetical protein
MKKIKIIKKKNQSLQFSMMIQIPILWSLAWSDRGSNPRSTALEASTLVIFSSYVYRDVQHTIYGF